MEDLYFNASGQLPGIDDVPAAQGEAVLEDKLATDPADVFSEEIACD